MRIVYSDHRSTFEELVEGDKTFSIHHKNIQSLFIEIYNFLVRHDEQRFSFKENNRFSLRNAYERLHLFLQNKYKKMETRLPMPALQEICNILVSFKNKHYFLGHSTICEESY